MTGCLSESFIHKPKWFKSQSLELSGHTSGYGNLRTDGTADFGLVLKNFSKADLFQIELDDLMSTSIDSINVFGMSLDLPSNVALPDQRERYILSIRLNKPQYRVSFEEGQNTSVILLHGQFPFTKVIDGFRNDVSLLQLAGDFNILSYTEAQGPLAVSGQGLQKDLVAGQNLLTETHSVSAPQQIPASYNFVAVSLLKSSMAQGYFPTDIKVIPARRSADIKIERQSPALFTGLFHNDFASNSSQGLNKFKMSLQLHNSLNQNTKLLDFVEDLNYAQGSLSYTAPQPSSSPLPSLSTLAIGTSIKIYKTKPLGLAQSPELVFSTYELGSWTGFIDLSGFESVRDPQAQYRLELNLHASTLHNNAQNEHELYEFTELVTRNALTL